MGTVPRVYADERGIWSESRSGQRFGIEWPDIYSVAGYKLFGGDREETICIELDWDFGEYHELNSDSPGFPQVVAAISERLPGIDPGWFGRIATLRSGDAAVEVWKRGEQRSC